MNDKIDNSLILNKIKSHYKIKSDAIFAGFLGIRPNTLANWRTRNTLDYSIIITKCVDIDANWLLTGKGEMLKKNEVIEDVTTVSEPQEHYGTKTQGHNNSKDLIIETQQKLIVSLEKNVLLLEEKLRTAESIITTAKSTQSVG